MFVFHDIFTRRSRPTMITIWYPEIWKFLFSKEHFADSVLPDILSDPFKSRLFLYNWLYLSYCIILVFDTLAVYCIYFWTRYQKNFLWVHLGWFQSWTVLLAKKHAWNRLSRKYSYRRMFKTIVSNGYRWKSFLFWQLKSADHFNNAQ